MAGKKTYRTANGNEIDFQKIQLQNETVRAVGNMNINARGDVIDNTNKTTSTRSAQVNKSYRKQIGNVARDLPIVSSIADVQAEEIVSGLDDEPSAEPVEAQVEAQVEAPTEAPTGGLAGAMAKARESKNVKE